MLLVELLFGARLNYRDNANFMKRGAEEVDLGVLKFFVTVCVYIGAVINFTVLDNLYAEFFKAPVTNVANYLSN